MVSVATSSLGHTDLFFIDQGTKSIIIEMSCFINSFCQPFATCDDFFTFQQNNAPAHKARLTVQLLTCETPDFIAPALWPANSPDLNPVDYQTW